MSAVSVFTTGKFEVRIADKSTFKDKNQKEVCGLRVKDFIKVTSWLGENYLQNR